MRSRNASAGFIIPVFAGLAVLGTLAIWLAANKGSLQGRNPIAPQAALFQTQVGERPASSSAAFGLAPGQVARLNIVNKGEEQGIIIEWKFLAGDGGVLKAASEAVTVPPGGISSFQIAENEIPRPRDRFNRAELRAVVYALGGPDTFQSNAGIWIDIFDATTGRSAFVVTMERPVPRAAPVTMASGCGFGLAPGQAARLNILNKGNDVGFIINWKFLAEDHAELKASREPATVQPGTISSFDITDDEIRLPRDAYNRVQLRSVVYSLGGPDTFERNAELSIEVFDRATGRSSIFLSGAEVKGCSNNL